MGRTFSDIVSEVASRLRLDIAASPDMLANVQGWVNDAIEDVHGRHDWFWSLDRQTVQTVLEKTAGTVSIVSGGSTVTGSSTSFAAADVGKFIQFSGDNDWYKITAVSASDSLTIEGGYIGTSDLSGGGYKIRKVFYSLPDAEKILSAKQATTRHDIVCINHKDFDTFLTFNDDTGPAREFCVYGVDSSNNIQFNIYPNPDKVYNIEIKYKKKASESTIAATPEKWREVYSDGALSRGLEYIALGQTGFDRNLISMKGRDYEGWITRMLLDAEPESDYQCVLMNRDVANSLPVPRLPTGLSVPLD